MILSRPQPASAGCVSCGPGGECFEASQGFSANCECRIRSVNGVTLCRPSGICDPTDARTCNDNPWIPVRPGSKISTWFINDLAQENPLLAGAVWGAIVEEASAEKRDVQIPRISAGEYTGTMGKDGRSYIFHTEVRQTAGEIFSLSIRLEEEETGRIEEFEGVLFEGGRSGDLVRVGRKGRTPVFSWNARDQARRGSQPEVNVRLAS